MQPGIRRIIGLSARAAAVLVVLAVVWVVVAPVYTGAIAGLAQTLSPALVKIQAEGNEVALVYEQPALSRYPSARINGLTFHGGLILMAALVLVSPEMHWKRRLLWLASWTGALLMFHVLTFALFAWALKWGADGAGINLRDILPFVPLTHIVIPAMAGGLWCSRYWLMPSLADRSRS